MALSSNTSKLVPSDEADRKGLEFGRRQGDALASTVEHMINVVAEAGGEVQSGEYLVGYAVEEAEGMYCREDGELRWTESQEANVHIEAWVRDAADGRFIPGLRVYVTVVGQDGQEVGTHEHPLLWHPYLYHYGRNWTVPGSGRYTVKVRFDPPGFPRHDKQNGRRFLDGGEVVFEGIQIETGRK